MVGHIQPVCHEFDICDLRSVVPTIATLGTFVDSVRTDLNNRTSPESFQFLILLMVDV